MPTKSIYWSDQNYRDLVQRLRDRIAAGEGLILADDDTPGAKDLTCTWGLCVYKGKKNPHPKRHRCPLDRRERDDGRGCFYHCRMFSPLPGMSRPDRDLTLRLFDRTLISLPVVSKGEQDDGDNGTEQQPAPRSRKGQAEALRAAGDAQAPRGSGPGENDLQDAGGDVRPARPWSGVRAGIHAE